MNDFYSDKKLRPQSNQWSQLISGAHEEGMRPGNIDQAQVSNPGHSTKESLTLATLSQLPHPTSDAHLNWLNML